MEELCDGVDAGEIKENQDIVETNAWLKRSGTAQQTGEETHTFRIDFDISSEVPPRSNVLVLRNRTSIIALPIVWSNTTLRTVFFMFNAGGLALLLLSFSFCFSDDSIFRRSSGVESLCAGKLASRFVIHKYAIGVLMIATAVNCARSV